MWFGREAELHCCIPASASKPHGKSPAEAGPLKFGCCFRRYFLLEPESDDVLWFAAGWLAIDEFPLCEGDCPVVFD